jgi:AraC family transcriptional regulator, glycine betaine-responsive activator
MSTIDLSAIKRIGFLTLPNYSMIALANALEACRMANYVTGTDHYMWQVLCADGVPVAASNGLSLEPTRELGEAGSIDLLLVCGGVDVRAAVSRAVLDALRRFARRGGALGSLCTGTFALAEAGLLDSYRCAIHWENLSAIREEFHDITFVEDPFVIDRDRLTCTGGVAPLDMMLELIKARLGPPTAAAVSTQFLVRRTELGRANSAVAGDLIAGHPVVARAVQVMQSHIEAPLAIGAVAGAVALSERQLERLFKRYLGQRPAEFYLHLRLARARELLRLSELAITDIGLACGFQSAAHFSTAYSRHFGHPPRAERSS